MDQWQPYFISTLVGLLVGIERERSHTSSQALGVRTFLLISLLGAVAKGVDSLWLSGMIAAFAFSLIAISYFNQTRLPAENPDRGLTTEFAAGLIFCLGYASHQFPSLAASLGPAVAIILFSKRKLHRFTRALKPSELESALLLFLFVVIVINVFPDETIDPWQIFNPKKFGYLVLALAGLEFSSYLLTKMLGEKKGSLIIGFLGGFVSSTAVLISSSRHARASDSHWRSSLSSASAATLASFIELLLIVGFISSVLLKEILPAIGAAILTGLMTLVFLARKQDKRGGVAELRSPLDWFGILRLSLLLAGILGGISFVRNTFGIQSTAIVSFLTGLFELHGVALANATLASQDQLSGVAAKSNILLAALASLVAKVVIGWSVGKGPFAKGLTLVLFLMGFSLGAAAWIF